MTGPAYKSDAWKQLVETKMEEWIQDPFAIQWVHDYCDLTEFFDDLYDHDWNDPNDPDKAIDRAYILRTLDQALVDMPGNPFFLANAGRLIPCIIAGIRAWRQSCALEHNPTEHNLHYAFVLRSVYMQIIEEVVEIVRGRDVARQIAPEIHALFAKETFAEYRKEFNVQIP